GVNIGQVNKYGDTALIFAAREGRSEVLKILIEKGAIKIKKINMVKQL
ncbi:MAG: ankyrin repeat domain-containing protein, partial [Rickettsia sp.]|nr:ankyrin repeat domain-containing protein [Rickettsia sp.]